MSLGYGPGSPDNYEPYPTDNSEFTYEALFTADRGCIVWPMSKFDAAPTLAAGILRSARQKADMTQRELAVAAGVSQQVVSAYETGRREPTLPTLLRLVRAAGLDLRFHLEPLDRHDSGLAEYLESLPPKLRTELDEAERTRVQRSRLRSIRGR